MGSSYYSSYFYSGYASSLFSSYISSLNIKQARLKDKVELRLSDGLKKVPAMIKDFLVAAGTEGSEEVLTDLANELWDYLTNGGLSEYETARASGMTPAEYAKQFGMDLLESFAAGAASGGLSYAAMSGKNYTTNKAITAARNAATGKTGYRKPGKPYRSKR